MLLNSFSGSEESTSDESNLWRTPGSAKNTGELWVPQTDRKVLTGSCKYKKYNDTLCYLCYIVQGKNSLQNANVKTKINTFYIKRKGVETKSNKYNDIASKKFKLLNLQPAREDVHTDF